ncbi:hypothetical protein NPIL_92241, partial [Nephila pilipes]
MVKKRSWSSIEFHIRTISTRYRRKGQRGKMVSFRDFTAHE